MDGGDDVEVVIVQMDELDDVEAQMDVNNQVEVIELQMDGDNLDGQLLPGDVEIIDVLPADAQAEFDLMETVDNLFDFQFEQVLLNVPVEVPRDRVPLIDRPAAVRNPLPEQNYIGALNVVCTHCQARHFFTERRSRGHFALCCNNDQMRITMGPRLLQQAPELLMSLLVDDSQVAREYRGNIRRYNNTLAFAAFSTDLNQRRLPGRGPRVFTVHGQVYRRITNDVVNNDLRQPRYCELYFVESGEANQIRMQQQPDRLSERLITDLDTMLRQINPFAQAFR